MRKYEVMLILPADADEAAVKGAADRISKVIGETNGEVTKSDVWGRRRLAFEIDKRTEGYYVVVDMTADPTTIKELERVLHLADDVVRFKVVAKPPPRIPRIPRAKLAAQAEAAAAAPAPAAEPLAEAAEPDPQPTPQAPATAEEPAPEQPEQDDKQEAEAS
jgi:small subunit ribosomal protein S6